MKLSEFLDVDKCYGYNCISYGLGSLPVNLPTRFMTDRIASNSNRDGPFSSNLQGVISFPTHKRQWALVSREHAVSSWHVDGFGNQTAIKAVTEQGTKIWIIATPRDPKLPLLHYSYQMGVSKRPDWLFEAYILSPGETL